MSLKEYRRKRKFDKTPEPAPKDKVAKGRGPLTFVVQKHDATRTHYDFRLELDGALLSWAVPKGPSLTSGDPRLAVHVEDHPLDYGTFEGTIPKGNYGAGTVMVWDSGTYVERGSEGRKDSETAMRAGMEKGHITFVLTGEKLNGEFALVKIKKKGAPPKGWLLVKKHDAHASRHDILKEDRSAATGRLMEEIAAQAEAKGEVWIPGKGRKGKGDKTKQKKSAGSDFFSKPTAKPAPVPKPAKPTKVAPQPLAHKTAKAPKAAELPRRVRPMEPVTAPVIPAGNWIFESYGAGLRTIAEVDGGLVRLHSRSLLSFDRKFPSIATALKKLGMKAVLDGEVVAKGKAATYFISDLLFLDGKDLRDMSLESRKAKLGDLKLSAPLVLTDYADSLDALDPSPYYVAKNPGTPYRSGISRDWLKFRGNISKTAKANAGEDRPPLTHPDKIYFPKAKITKGDLAKYYESVADVILPYLVDRPQSLHRQPDGLRNEGFFHKDMSGFLPKRIKTVRVFSGSSEKTVNYALCQDKWSLLFLVNLGCIELNPWLSRQPDLEKPDYVVIDLDPDDNDFKQVVQVAQAVHRVLDAVGAESHCKTSGSSGLHICIPTGAQFDFDTGRLFAEAVCRVVNAELPKITSVERNPNKRKGRIYLDFLQNRRSQTLAAPYCVRPREKATVSAPLKWDEVKPGLSPEQFTIHTMAKRLAKVGDLWEPLLNSRVDIEACMKRLSKKFHK